MVVAALTSGPDDKLPWPAMAEEARAGLTGATSSSSGGCALVRLQLRAEDGPRDATAATARGVKAPASASHSARPQRA